MQGHAISQCPLAYHHRTLSPVIPSAPLVRGHPRTACTHKRFFRQTVQLKQSYQKPRASSQTDTLAAAAPALSDTPLQQLSGEQTALPAAAGVYAVYDKDGTLQYIGLSRKVLLRTSRSRCVHHFAGFDSRVCLYRLLSA